MRLTGRIVRKYSLVFRRSNLSIDWGMDIPLSCVTNKKKRQSRPKLFDNFYCQITRTCMLRVSACISHHQARTVNLLKRKTYTSCQVRML